MTFNQNCEKMKVYYVRVSTVDQKTDRQRINQKEFDLVVEDKCSGSIPFFERDGGKKIKQLIDKKIMTSLSVWTIDRLGRDLLDVLHTIQFLSEKGIRIHFIQQGLISLDDEGKENPISKMIISILGIDALVINKSPVSVPPIKGKYAPLGKTDVLTLPSAIKN
jgi:DNA invertase Pin-like site-specific DNA recombinase